MNEEKSASAGSNAESLLLQSWLADPQNPMNLSPVRKWMIVLLLVITNLIA